jgi:hypothetical protein
MAASFNAVTVTTTATLILSPSNGRRGFLIKNNGSNIAYIGFTSSVLSTTGIPIMPQDSFTITGEHAVWKGAVYGITSAATTDCRYWDWTV